MIRNFLLPGLAAMALSISPMLRFETPQTQLNSSLSSAIFALESKTNHQEDYLASKIADLVDAVRQTNEANQGEIERLEKTVKTFMVSTESRFEDLIEENTVGTLDPDTAPESGYGTWDELVDKIKTLEKEVESLKSRSNSPPLAAASPSYGSTGSSPMVSYSSTGSSPVVSYSSPVVSYRSVSTAQPAVVRPFQPIRNAIRTSQKCEFVRTADGRVVRVCNP